jgi:hypothetical protein
VILLFTKILILMTIAARPIGREGSTYDPAYDCNRDAKSFDEYSGNQGG